MKNKLLTVLVIAALVIVVGIYFYASSEGTTISNVINKAINNGANGGVDSSDRGTNGYWDEASQNCFPTSEKVSVGKIETLKNGGMFTCCFDTEFYQVDCNSDKRFSDKPVLNAPATYAIYTTAAGTNTGKAWIVQGVTLTNNGNIDYTKVWIQDAAWTQTPNTWSSGLTEVNRAWGYMEGYNNAQAIALGKGEFKAFNFAGQVIDAQKLSPNKNTLETYNLTLTAMGSYLFDDVQSNYSQTQTSWFKATKEEAGLSIAINLNA